MRPLRVLLTNNTLDPRAGSELYVRDLATALLDRGHHPIAFSTVLGEVADELRRRTVPVVDDLCQLSAPPDVIHGHHHLETMTALLHFPGTPAISVCHGWVPWEEAPPKFPRILRHVAVDETCLDRLTCEHGIEPSSVRLLLNFVDLARFRPRGPLPAAPARAAVLNNEISDENVLPAIRMACQRRGLTVHVFGRAAGTAIPRPEDVLGSYDIVFAKARAALEAMAVGTAVVLCSAGGLGPMVTSENVGRLRRLNFGVRALGRTVTADGIETELARYDPADASAASAQIRQDAGRERAVDEWIRLYEEVIDEYARRGPADVRAESRAAAAYLRSLSASLKTHAAALHSITDLRAANRALSARVAVFQANVATPEASVSGAVLGHVRRAMTHLGPALRARASRWRAPAGTVRS